MARRLTKLWIAGALLTLGLIVAAFAYEWWVSKHEDRFVSMFTEVTDEIVEARMSPREAVVHIRTRISHPISIGSNLTAFDIDEYGSSDLPPGLDGATNVSIGIGLPRLNRFWPRSVLASISFNNGAAYYASVYTSDEARSGLTR